MSPQPSGKRGRAGAPAINPFISNHVPLLWGALTREFGRTIDYWPDNDSAQAITLTVVWKEGTEDEESSPGRYSHAYIRNADLPLPPKLGDAAVKDGIEYDIVRVDAYAVYHTMVVLQDRSEDF